MYCMYVCVAGCVCGVHVGKQALWTWVNCAFTSINIHSTLTIHTYTTQFHAFSSANIHLFNEVYILCLQITLKLVDISSAAPFMPVKQMYSNLIKLI